MTVDKSVLAVLDQKKSPLSPAALDAIRALAGHDLPQDYCEFMLRFGAVSFGDQPREFRYDYSDADGMQTEEWNALAEINDAAAMQRMRQQFRGFYPQDLLDAMLIIGAVPNGDPIFMGFGDRAGIWLPIGHGDDGVWNPGTGGALVKIAESFSAFLGALS